MGPDWLGACRRATAAVGAILAEHPTIADRVVEVGTIGEGGDRTLAIDAAAEEAIFTELEGLHAAGARFTAVSEERGAVDFGGDATLVLVDPIDGSVNAKRMLSHVAVSIAVAEGRTMADVRFGFVHDLGTGEEWVAAAGRGALVNGTALPRKVAERRVGRDNKLEVIGIESADPRWVVEAGDSLVEVARRLRAFGSIAVTMCQVAAGRLDGMVTLRRCRAVDAAAAQLIVREAGGLVRFTGCAEPLGAPLDLEPHSPVVAARTDAGLTALAAIPLH
jgi:myo-inositol-1(or 4)-monophosphatase